MEKKCIRYEKFPAQNKSFPLKTEKTIQQLMYVADSVSKIEHYGSVCKNKSEFRERKDRNFLSSFLEKLLEKVNSVEREEQFEWQEKIKVTTKVCRKIIYFRLDTGADMTVILDRFFKKTPQLYERQKIIWTRS